MPGNPSPSSSPQLFHCPTCGASLPSPDAPTVRCQYCGSNVVVPAEFLPRKQEEEDYGPAEPIVIQMSTTSVDAGRSAGRAVGVIIAVVVFLFVAGFIVTGLLIAGGIFATTAVVNSSIDSLITQAAPPTEIQALLPPTEVLIPATPTPIPAASLALQFGGEGSGPGQFDDSRHIAVDTDGNIYVAEYTSGRIQKFDPGGKFLQVINVEPDRNGNTIIRDIGTNYAGQLLVARSGDILVYTAADGSLANTLPGSFPDLNYDALAIDLSNNIYTLSDAVEGSDLIKLDAQGNNAWVVESYMSQIEKNASSGNQRIAVDGSGNSYINNGLLAQIIRFNAQGQFSDRFGSKGDEPGQLSGPFNLAVDGKGRVFVIDTGSIDVFDSTGGFLEEIDWDYQLGGPMDLTVDAQGDLYVVTNLGQVLKFTLNF